MGKKKSKIKESNIKNQMKSLVRFGDDSLAVQINKDDLSKVLEESFYKALTRYENDKSISKVSDKKDTNIKKKEKSFLPVSLFLLWPFAFEKYAKKNTYDILLTWIISEILILIGTCLWASGIVIIGTLIYAQFLNMHAILPFGIAFVSTVFGSISILSGKAFSRENDSAKIHAFSACIFALISCIIAIIALIK